MSVTAPRGFRAAGVAAGMKASGRLDLGVLVADAPAATVGLFTTNAFPAAPVVLSRERLASGRATAVVVNSGQANAGTGEAGTADAYDMAEATAEALAVAPQEVLVCSTGVIGPRVRMEAFREGIPRAAADVTEDGGERFAEAILTTDRGPKETLVEADGFAVGGCVKGAGMIAPELATMLAFLTTDAPVAPDDLDAIVRRVVAPVFGNLTVDGCTSTNDTVLVMASGASEVAATPGSPAEAALEAALHEASVDLARRLVAEAEGSSKTLVVHVTGASDDDAARTVGRSLASSLLVKTALFGEDPNPGRLLQAVGAAGVALDPAGVGIDLAGYGVIEAGVVAPFDELSCREALKERDVVVRVDLGVGEGEATFFGCDLGYEYVRINAEYRT